MSWNKYITAGIITLIIQILVCEFANIWPPLYITVLPLFIVILPLEVNMFVLILCAFGMGLATDAFADGVLGLNAAALTIVAYCKYFFINRLTKYESETLAESMHSLSSNYSIMFMLIMLCYALFFFVYILLDTNFTSGFFFVRFVLNVIVNTLIAYILERLWIRRLLL